MDRTMTLPIPDEEQQAKRTSTTMAFIRRSGLLALATGVSMVLVPFVRLQHLQEAAGGRPNPGRYPRQGGGPWRRGFIYLNLVSSVCVCGWALDDLLAGRGSATE